MNILLKGITMIITETTTQAGAHTETMNLIDGREIIIIIAGIKRNTETHIITIRRTTTTTNQETIIHQPSILRKKGEDGLIHQNPMYSLLAKCQENTTQIRP